MPIRVSEVLAAAAQLVGRDDLANGVGAAKEDAEITLLCECFHFIESEIALEYFPLKKTERVKVTEGKVEFSAFSKVPLEVLSVRSPSGMGIPFSVYEDHIAVGTKEGEADISYAYAPSRKGKEDASELPERATLSLLSHGVAAEFLLAHGSFAEAAVFETKYREALASAFRTRRAKLSVPARRWF